MFYADSFSVRIWIFCSAVFNDVWQVRISFMPSSNCFRDCSSSRSPFSIASTIASSFSRLFSKSRDFCFVGMLFLAG